MQIFWLVLIGLLVLLALFVLVLLVNTAAAKLKSRRLTDAPEPHNAEQCSHYAERLGRMIQCRTVSEENKYDDTEFAKLRRVMKELFPLVHEKSKVMSFGNDCWIYKLSGKDSSRNIMLMSHHDVVPVKGEWKYDGFSGETAEGKVWGRGTVDTKTPLFAEFSAIEELLASGSDLLCNVYIGSSHNEELGGDGIPLAFEYFKENGITFEVILDEGGAVIEPPLGGMKCDKCAMVAVHEKGTYYISCSAASDGGHAGLTASLKKSPVERMAAFICEATNANLFIRRLNPQIKAMFRHLGPYCSFPMNLLFANLWCFGGILTKVMPKLNPQAGGLIGTTCYFRDVHTDEDNKHCTARAFLRPVDGADLQKDIDTFRKLAEKHGVDINIETRSEYHAPADMKQRQFAYTMKCIAEVFPEYPASPFILPAGTDARTLTDICPCVLRFAPIRLSAQQLASVHSENENIDIECIPRAIEFYKHFVKNYK